MTVLHETLNCDQQRNAARVARLARMSPPPAKPKPMVIEIVECIEPEPIPVERKLPESVPVPERINKVHKVNRIIYAACRHFGIPRDQLIGPSHRQDLAFPRHVAMYAARAFTKESFPEIGRRFDKRDHSAVWHAFGKIARLLIVDDRVAADCEDLARAIGAVV